MKNESYLRYLLFDNHSLNKYYVQHQRVKIDDVKRSVLLKVRSQQYFVPDHYYRLGTEYSFEGITQMSELFTRGLSKLADEYLVWNDGVVKVKGERMNDWQLLLSYIPPLLLVVAKIWKEHAFDQADCTDFAHDYLLPSVRFTAMPSAYLPEMEAFKADHQGFSDLHIHLNGAIETDLAWHDFLAHPDKVYAQIRQACNNSKVKEQLEQLTDLADPIDFLNLFTIARNIREWLFEQVVVGVSGNSEKSTEDLLAEFQVMSMAQEHPFKHFFVDDASPLVMEGMFYVKVLDYLAQQSENDLVACCFHYYLLILGICNRLLVQQLDAFGFEQFQKYTSNNFREFSEETYKRRFLQLAGNDLKNINHLEGRFSPKKTLEDNLAIIDKISDGFAMLQNHQDRYEVKRSSLSLVAHFIKKSYKYNADIRFENLRHELVGRTDALIALLNTHGKYAQMIRGIDAAASEFDTPPEVFADSYRRLRTCGVKHFTYHAGEDFFHILSGLRAVYEAIYFLDLKTGDRIGHATVTGVDVALWRENIGEKLWIRQEEYMDDLVFAYYMIAYYQEKSLIHLLPNISLQVAKYSSAIYQKSYNIHELIEAWQLRREDFEQISAKPEDSLSRVERIYCQYHSKAVQNRGQKIIAVDSYDLFDEKELTLLQHLLLRIMHQKQVVIETLPTSNVMIGQHHNFATYHLYNWYKWSKEGLKVPAIVVGSDDAGIFATNIYNEYCHIYCLLVFVKGLSPHSAMEYIKHLDHNAQVYAFK